MGQAPPLDLCLHTGHHSGPNIGSSPWCNPGPSMWTCHRLHTRPNPGCNSGPHTQAHTWAHPWPHTRLQCEANTRTGFKSAFTPGDNESMVVDQLLKEFPAQHRVPHFEAPNGPKPGPTPGRTPGPAPGSTLGPTPGLALSPTPGPTSGSRPCCCSHTWSEAPQLFPNLVLPLALHQAECLDMVLAPHEVQP